MSGCRRAVRRRDRPATARTATTRVGRCPGTAPPGTTSAWRSCATLVRAARRLRRRCHAAASRSSRSATTTSRSCATPTTEWAVVVVAPRAGSATGGAARRRATGPSRTARSSTELLSGARGDVTDGRLDLPATPPGVAHLAGDDGAHDRADVSADFVFGTLATDELRLAQLRATASGVHHGHDLEPPDPDPASPSPSA